MWICLLGVFKQWHCINYYSISFKPKLSFELDKNKIHEHELAILCFFEPNLILSLAVSSCLQGQKHSLFLSQSRGQWLVPPLVGITQAMGAQVWSVPSLPLGQCGLACLESIETWGHYGNPFNSTQHFQGRLMRCEGDPGDS